VLPSEAGWAQVRLKHIASNITSGSRDWSEYFTTDGSPFIRIGNLSRGELALKLDDLQMVSPPSGSEGMRTQVAFDDILLSITAYLGSVALADATVVGGFVSQHIASVRIGRDDVFPRWVAYALLAPQGQEQLGAAAYGGTKIQLSLEDVRNLLIPLPPLELQVAFCERLDRELGQLDELLRGKERLLGLLTEKRKAIIATAVTRGLDPKAKLRDCGVPWLGEIPAHWETERARWLFRERDVRSTTGDEEMLTVSHLTGVTPRSEKDVNMFEAETNEGYKLCEPGDLVINTLWAWMGAMGIAPVKGIVSPAYNVYEPGPRLAPAYIDALVRLPVFAQEVTRYSKGVWSSRLRLYPEGFFEVYLPVPPQDEQRAIVEHIARETAKLDAARAATERTIALLKERRSALIAAAVTGQLDLTTDEGAAA
jgi:type I restriction enzyme S subunit